MRSRFFLGEVADSVLRASPEYYEEDLMNLIPDKLLDTEFHRKNTYNLMVKIDKLRFQKQRELARILGTKDPEELNKAINSPLGSLPIHQEQVRKEIKFLFNVASTLIHW